MADRDLHYAPHAPARDEARIVSEHLPMVRRIAWHVHGRVRGAVEIEDLLQVGVVALIEAARAYEVRPGASFATYASIRVRGALIDQLRKQASTHRRAISRRRALDAKRSQLSVELRRQPDVDELAAALGISAGEVHDIVRDGVGIRYESIDDIYSDHSMWFADAVDLESEFDASALRGRLEAALSRLPEREALVLQLYFLEELNLEEIGLVLDVGAARVCQIKRQALDRVRRILTDPLPATPASRVA